MIDPSLIIKKPKIDRMFQNYEFVNYLVSLFKFTGIMNWLDIQGAWTFVLFPSTNGGRYYTLNIGPHEVAFSTLARKNQKSVHMLLMDRLIFDFSEVLEWVCENNGQITEDCYATALPRSTSIMFEGTFEKVNEFMNIDGVRRALIAYWNEALIRLKERNSQSIFAKHHNWNAIAEIHNRIINEI